MLRLDFWNLLFTIINIIILYMILKKLLIGPVTRIMDQRKAMIEGSMSDAEEAKTQANEMKKQYEDTLAAAGDDAEKVILQAKADANDEYKRIVEEAGTEVVKMKKDASESIRIEQEQAKRDMESQVADLAMAAATKVLADTNSAAGNRALYEQFLQGVGESNETTVD